MPTSIVRWGILSTAHIARKNWRAIAHSGNGVVAAVASRSPDRCRQFIAECQQEAPFHCAPRAHHDYETLVSDPEIDALYIPLPTGLRTEWVLRAAQAGKHIVCEKPCAISLADLRRIQKACQTHRVQFMDGVMFMHSRRLQAIRRALQDPETVGDIRRITTQFSFLGAEDFRDGNIRMDGDLEPLGCLGDLGWYCLRFALWVMQGVMPVRAEGRVLAAGKRPGSSRAVPTQFSGELEFPGGVTAGFYCSFETAVEQWAHIGGTRGSLWVRDFVLPFEGDEMAFETHRAEYRTEGCDFRMVPSTRSWTVAERSHGDGSAQETNLFRTMGDLVLSDRRDETWMEWSLKTQEAMESCWRAAGPIP